ncbi:hypothetical protein OF83DRAFT_1169895 [Amylostereum chailletii]|nr:hypothetical protein OF83DRAFT_1169895 [Amylostereum chailletii]
MGHSRGFSADPAPDYSLSQDGPSTPRTSRSGWKFRRAAVLGAFSSPQPSTSTSSSSPEPASSSDMLNIARPSFSSSRTFSSSNTGTSTELSTPHKRTRTPSRSSSATRFKAPSPSLWSLPLHASHMNDPPGSETMLASEKPGSIRIPFMLKTPVATSPTLRHVPSMLPLPSNRRKKKLVISGIAMNDNHRVQNVRRWCETFGEVHQISRVKNGDLHVEFRKAEVADTVCRLNARVYIADVGSVVLSWYSGKKH